MYKVLIVDDEPAVCKGLGLLIDWKAYGFEVADYALNGLEAMEKIRAGKFDVVITDIRMPEVDGIELIKRIRELRVPCRLIILSGIKDFEYARAALEYGVESYILKPVGEEELIRTLTGIREEIEEELRKKISYRESERIIRQKVLTDLTKPGIDNYIAFKRGTEIGLTLDCESYRICIVEIDDFNELDCRTERFVIKNILEEIVQGDEMGYVFELEDNRFGILFCTGVVGGDRAVKHIVQELFDNIPKYSHKQVTIAIGSCVTGYAAIPESFRNARKTLERKLVGGGNRILHFEECEAGLGFAAVMEAEKICPNKTVDGIVKYVREHYFEELSLTTISKLYYMSPVYLGRLFKSITGVGFVEYVNHCRVEQAARLLESDELMVYEISEKVGYKDINYFYKVFKAKKGITPSEFRVLYGKNKLKNGLERHV